MGEVGPEDCLNGEIINIQLSDPHKAPAVEGRNRGGILRSYSKINSVPRDDIVESSRYLSVESICIKTHGGVGAGGCSVDQQHLAGHVVHSLTVEDSADSDIDRARGVGVGL